MTGIPYHKTKYHKLSDIPDKYIKLYSERDPNNKIYQTRRWYDFKKRQILFSQHDGVPVYLRTPRMRFFYYTSWVLNVGTAVFMLYSLNEFAAGRLKR